jgi:hypothetical protein
MSTWPKLFPVTELDELAAEFEAAAIPAAAWTHHAHLRVGAILIHRQGKDAALELLREGIRRLNAAHGTVDSDTRGYHETITRCYVHFIDQFLRSCPREMTFDRRVEELLRSALASRDFLLRYYARETLMSPEARRGWVAPDLQPLPG